MLGLPQRYSLARMSDGRCSTATSGVYSATESDSSNSPDLYANQTSRRWSLGLPDVEKNMEKPLYQNCHNNINHGNKHISRIPPPKPRRYHLHPAWTNQFYLRANSNSENTTRTIEPISRISQTKNESASYMHINRKESHILV